MKYLALNREQLSRFSHHWLWGRRVDNQHENTLYDAALTLESDELLRQQREEEIARMSQRTWMIRATCWFLNVGNYRAHYYQLQAYYSWQLYQKGIAMFSEQDQALVNASGVFIITAGAALAAAWVAPYMKQSLAWFSQALFPSLLSQDKIKVCDAQTAPNVPDADSPVLFIVDERMLDGLETLGITGGLGDSVSLEVLKSAYRKSCLRTHPDKTKSDNNAAFIAVVDAYNRILSCIEQGLSSKKSEMGSGLFNKINQDIARMKEETIQMMEEAVQMKEKAIWIQKELQRISEAASEVMAHSRRQTEQINEQTEEIKRQNVQLQELIDGFSELDRQQGARRAAANEPFAPTPTGIDDFHQPGGAQNEAAPLNLQGFFAAGVVKVSATPSADLASTVMESSV